METLTPNEAATLAGVPAAQLLRWAWEDWSTHDKKAMGISGPRNVGTRRKPRYYERDVKEWREKHEAVRPD